MMTISCPLALRVGRWWEVESETELVDHLFYLPAVSYRPNLLKVVVSAMGIFEVTG